MKKSITNFTSSIPLLNLLFSLTLLLIGFLATNELTHANSFTPYDRNQYPASVSQTELPREATIFAQYIYPKIESCKNNQISTTNVQSLIDSNKLVYCPEIDIVDRHRLKFLMELDYFSLGRYSSMVITGADANDKATQVLAENLRNGSPEGEKVTAGTYPNTNLVLVSDIKKGLNYALNRAFVNIYTGTGSPIVHDWCETKPNCDPIAERMDIMALAKNGSNEEMLASIKVYESIDDTVLKILLSNYTNIEVTTGAIKDENLSLDSSARNKWLATWIPFNDIEKSSLKLSNPIDYNYIYTPKSACAATGTGALLCMAERAGADSVVGSFKTLWNFMEISPAKVAQHQIAWERFRDLANYLTLIIILILIFLQVFKFNQNRNNIIKLIPRLIVVIILANISFYLVQILVDLSNIIGYGIAQFFSSITEPFDLLSGKFLYFVSGTLAGVALAGVIGYYGGLILAGTIIITGLFSLIGLLLALSFREIAISILIITSPLAFISLALSTNNKLFAYWWKTLSAMLMLRPLSILVLNASLFSYNLIVSTSSNPLLNFMSFLLIFLPVFFIPSLIITAVKKLPAIASSITGLTQNLSSPLIKSAKNTTFVRAIDSGQKRRLEMDKLYDPQAKSKLSYANPVFLARKTRHQIYKKGVYGAFGGEFFGNAKYTNLVGNINPEIIDRIKESAEEIPNPVEAREVIINVLNDQKEIDSQDLLGYIISASNGGQLTYEEYSKAITHIMHKQDLEVNYINQFNFEISKNFLNVNKGLTGGLIRKYGNKPLDIDLKKVAIASLYGKPITEDTKTKLKQYLPDEEYEKLMSSRANPNDNLPIYEFIKNTFNTIHSIPSEESKVEIAKKMFMDSINSFEGLPDFSDLSKLNEDELIDFKALSELKKDPEFINRLKLIQNLSPRASEFFNKS